MGLFDSIVGAVQGVLGQGVTQQLEAALVEKVLASGAAGGLGPILQKLEQAGLGQQVQSWIGSGPNQPVDPTQIANALGADHLAELAKSVGLSPELIGTALSQFLPGIVDKLSPNGTLPPQPGH